MYFIIYKTMNLLNGKYYIGKHQTKKLDDGYLGSGKYLLRAIKKYGEQNFVKEILHIFEHEWQMNLAERILVVPDQEVNYNLCSGGKGGFGYINKNLPNGMLGKRQTEYQKQKVKEWAAENRQFLIEIGKQSKNHFKENNMLFLGRTHADETKQKMRKNHNPRSHPIGVKRGPYKKKNMVL